MSKQPEINPDDEVYDWTPGFLGKQDEAEGWKCECSECAPSCAGDPFGCHDQPTCNCCDCAVLFMGLVQAENGRLVKRLGEVLDALRDGDNWAYIHSINAWRAGVAPGSEHSTITAGSPAERIYNALHDADEAITRERVS